MAQDITDSIYEISMLLDFYGQLLTDSQYRCMDMYYNQDLSLTEIAEELGISRQGAHDFIRRGRAALNEYEDKLGLLGKFSDIEKKLRLIQADLQLIDRTGMNDGNIYMLDQIEQNITGIITKL